MSRSKKTVTNPRDSVMHEGQLVESETMQKLFYHTHVCTVFKLKLETGQQFSKAEALAVMSKNMKKRQAHGTMNVLEDRLKLMRNKSGKEPFRRWLSYREIEDINVSTSKPEFFVLSVNSDGSMMRYYEVYKCKSNEATKQLVSYFKKGMEDPSFRIRDEEAISRMIVDDEERKSHYPMEEIPDVEDGHSSPEPEPSPIIYNTINDSQYNEPPARFSPVAPVRTVHSQMAPKSNSSFKDLRDVTYIAVDGLSQEARLDENGSHYLYFQRFDSKASQNGRQSDHYDPYGQNGEYSASQFPRYN